MAWREVQFSQARHGIAGDAAIRDVPEDEALCVYTVWPDGSLSFHVFVDTDNDAQAVVYAAHAYYHHFARYGEPVVHEKLRG